MWSVSTIIDTRSGSQAEARSCRVPGEHVRGGNRWKKEAAKQTGRAKVQGEDETHQGWGGTGKNIYK